MNPPSVTRISLIDHRPHRPLLMQIAAALQKILIIQRQGGGQETAGVDGAAGPKQNPIGIHQHHLAVGLQLPQNLTRILTDHPIEDGRMHIRLEELHDLAAADTKGPPVDDAGRTGL